MNNDVQLDLLRNRRVGISEAVLSDSKSIAQIEAALRQADAAGQPILLTRLSVEQFDGLDRGLRDKMDHDPVSRTAFYGDVSAPQSPPRVAVVCAGSSDRPVASEAERTLMFGGESVLSVSDVGVAGLWRLLERVEDLRSMAAIVAVAGMDGALPTVLSGLVPSAIVAVPTSVGYGVASDGLSALNAMLASCGPGLSVVNIDNGYGAACAVQRILNQLPRRP